MVTDIFDNKIFCKSCDEEMSPIRITRNGFILRAMGCPKCSAKILHPKDEQEYNNFINLRKKQFSVKMRFVGNSYAVSIPKEIVNFMKDQEKMMDDMVKLCLEEFGRLRLDFDCHDNYHQKIKDNIQGVKINGK